MSAWLQTYSWLIIRILIKPFLPWRMKKGLFWSLLRNVHCDIWKSVMNLQMKSQLFCFRFTKRPLLESVIKTDREHSSCLDFRFIVPTWNVCQRLFSIAGYTHSLRSTQISAAGRHKNATFSERKLKIMGPARCSCDNTVKNNFANFFKNIFSYSKTKLNHLYFAKILNIYSLIR